VEAGRAQQVWVRAYENEEDLWESFQEGEITSERYLELLGLFRAGADSMFQPLSDIDGLPGYAISDTVIDMSGGSAKNLYNLLSVRGLFVAGHPELRWGYTLPLQEETKDDGYLVGRWSSNRVQLFVDGRTRSGRFDGFRKRGLAIGFLGGRTRVTLGNFEPRFGLGLVVGRRDRQLGRTVATGLSGSVWQPKYAFYNGLQLEQTRGTAARLVVLGSRIESLPYREDIAAAHLVVAGGGNIFSAGITGAAGVISRRDDKRENKRGGVGLYLSRARDQNGLRAEFALAGGGAVPGGRMIRIFSSYHPAGPAIRGDDEWWSSMKSWISILAPPANRGYWRNCERVLAGERHLKPCSRYTTIGWSGQKTSRADSPSARAYRVKRRWRCICVAATSRARNLMNVFCITACVATPM
jgi:hypothetical protein